MNETQERPWGSWKIVHEQPADTLSNTRVVKILSINPGCMLSLQKHLKRNECWQPLDNGLIAYIEGRVTLLEPFQTHTIRAGEMHRLINPTAKTISVIETIIGNYDENDIIRYHDAYGRK